MLGRGERGPELAEGSAQAGSAASHGRSGARPRISTASDPPRGDRHGSAERRIRFMAIAMTLESAGSASWRSPEAPQSTETSSGRSPQLVRAPKRLHGDRHGASELQIVFMTIARASWSVRSSSWRSPWARESTQSASWRSPWARESTQSASWRSPRRSRAPDRLHGDRRDSRKRRILFMAIAAGPSSARSASWRSPGVPRAPDRRHGDRHGPLERPIPLHGDRQKSSERRILLMAIARSPPGTSFVSWRSP